MWPPLSPDDVWATLAGGPADGKRVRVIGTYYEVCLRHPKRMRSFFYARYEWDVVGDDYVGYFLGYFDRDGLRVDKIGRRIGRRAPRCSEWWSSESVTPSEPNVRPGALSWATRSAT